MTLEQFKELVDKAYKENPNGEVYVDTPHIFYEVKEAVIDEDGDLVMELL